MQHQKSAFFVLCGCLAAIILCSCALGLDPARSSDGTVVTFRLGGAASRAASATDSRAVFSGDGYLYIRLGGVAAGGQRLFGPYAVKAGEIFATTDIPAGSYPFVALLYSSEKIDSVYYQDFPLLKTFTADDATFLTVKSDNGFGAIFREATCGTFLYDVSILGGRPNEISATLDPLTAWATAYDTADNYWPAVTMDDQTDSSKLVRRFVRIDGLASCRSDAGYEPNFYATITPDTGVTLNLVAAYYYDADGSRRDISFTPGTYSDVYPASLGYGYTGNDTNYIYLEFYASGAFTIAPSYMD